MNRYQITGIIYIHIGMKRERERGGEEEEEEGEEEEETLEE